METSKDSSSNPRNFFTRQFDKRVRITAVVLVLSIGLGAALTLHAAWPNRIRKGYRPEQPFPYSHQLHAGSLQIACRYCHTRVDRGAEAMVPSLSICMNCHQDFRGDPGEPEQVAKIADLVKRYETGETIAWKKVYDLEDFVYFDHSRHVGRGLECINCHGSVETMPLVRKEYPLTMSWCLDCHMGNLEPRFSSQMLKTGKPLAEVVDDPVYREILAPIHCSTCHR